MLIDCNLGFAEGNYVRIRYLLDRAFDLVLLLNDDAVVDPKCLAQLMRAAATRPRGMVLHQLMRVALQAALLLFAGQYVRARAVLGGVLDGLERPLKSPRIELHFRRTTISVA